MEVANLGAGCFWCIEACFKDVKGILKVEPGYMGGHTSAPNYKDVCSGTTGYAEIAQVTFDTSLITFEELLRLFWFVHDPTQLNRQGNDIGTQYRSAIFYTSEEQKVIAEKYKQRLIDEKVWEKPVVTEIVPTESFFVAESYHHDYFELNPGNAYCQAVVRPKVDKFKKVFAEILK